MVNKYNVGDIVKIKEKLLPDDFDIVSGYTGGKYFGGTECTVIETDVIGGENCYCLNSKDEKWSSCSMDGFIWQEKALCRVPYVKIDW